MNRCEQLSKWQLGAQTYCDRDTGISHPQHSSEIKNDPNLTFHPGAICEGAAFALLSFVERAEVFFWQYRQLGMELASIPTQRLTVALLWL